jgi:hypothetical protein
VQAEAAEFSPTKESLSLQAAFHLNRGDLMKDYLSEQWRAVLLHNNLDDFERLWAVDAGWFEPLNERRGGWSGVSRCELDLPEGGKVGFFFKRQENHITRTLMHPLGIPTFAREMHNILLFKRASVPALEPVYFAVRKNAGQLRAILCTVALEGYIPLETLVEKWMREGWPKRSRRLQLMQAVADVMSCMHSHKIQHNCFYPKHIFVCCHEEQIRVRLIDLEKAKVVLLRRFATARDLYTLNRHSPGWSRTDRLRFLLLYCGLQHVNEDAKALWRQVALRSRLKGHG